MWIIIKSGVYDEVLLVSPLSRPVAYLVFLILRLKHLWFCLLTAGLGGSLFKVEMWGLFLRSCRVLLLLQMTNWGQKRPEATLQGVNSSPGVWTNLLAPGLVGKMLSPKARGRPTSCAFTNFLLILFRIGCRMFFSQWVKLGAPAAGGNAWNVNCCLLDWPVFSSNWVPWGYFSTPVSFTDYILILPPRLEFILLKIMCLKLFIFSLRAKKGTS